MANIRDLKKDINFVLGDIIDAVNVWQGLNADTDGKAADAIIDEAITIFDALIAKVNDKKVENRSAHLAGVRAELEEKARGLADKINSL